MSTNSERIILVTGATGQQGGAVYRHLQKKGFTLRALVRDPDSDKARRLMGLGGEVFRGSLDDPASLMRAMGGVYGVFSVQPFTANEIQQRVAVIEAAKLQGASHFAYASVGSAKEETGIPFEHPGKWENRTFSRAADELSMLQIADAFSRVTARDVKYVQVPWDQFEKTMGREMTVMYRWFEDKGFSFQH